jgi:uracil-DNA glycosylase family 4
MGPAHDIQEKPNDRCSLCPLRGNPIVPAHGPPQPFLVGVGEAPGEKEVELERPFVGPAGENLHAALDLVEIDAGSVHFTNATLCYPGRDAITGQYNHPSTESVAACRSRVLREIRATSATKVLATGGYAGLSLTGRPVVIETSRCVIAGPLQRHLLGDEVAVGLTYHPKARRSDPVADVAADLRCLLARP